jgi:hypothetical protein
VAQILLKVEPRSGSRQLLCDVASSQSVLFPLDLSETASSPRNLCASEGTMITRGRVIGKESQREEMTEAWE